MMRISTIIILGQSVLLLVCLGFLAHLLMDNYVLKSEAKSYATTAGFARATHNFLRGNYCLYEVKLFKFGFNDNDSGIVPTDGETKPAGKTDGGFQVYYFLVDQGFPKVHQEIQQAFVDGYNEQMRRYFEHPEWFDKNGQRIPMNGLQKQTTNSAK